MFASTLSLESPISSVESPAGLERSRWRRGILSRAPAMADLRIPITLERATALVKVWSLIGHWLMLLKV